MKKGKSGSVQKAVPGIATAESKGKARNLANQPKSSRSVAGAESPSGSRGARPSASRNVPGIV